MLASITTLLSRDGINVENLSNKSRGDYAYTIVDLSAPADQCVIDEVTALENEQTIFTLPSARYVQGEVAP